VTGTVNGNVTAWHLKQELLDNVFGEKITNHTQKSKILEIDICRLQTLRVRVKEKNNYDYKNETLKYNPNDMLMRAAKSEICTEGNQMNMKNLLNNYENPFIKKCLPEEITIETDKPYIFSRKNGNNDHGWKLPTHYFSVIVDESYGVGIPSVYLNKCKETTTTSTTTIAILISDIWEAFKKIIMYV